jgi:hypothetical protein
MTKYLKFVSISILTLFILGCGTQVIKYEAQKNMAFSDAVDLIDRLIMEQHRAWRPDFVEINNRYILLGYGMVTQGRGTAFV